MPLQYERRIPAPVSAESCLCDYGIPHVRIPTLK